MTSVAALAQERHIPLKWMQSYGFADLPGGAIRIEHRDTDGSLARSSVRENVSTSHPTKWAMDEKHLPIVPFGADRIPKWRDRGDRILRIAEGATDPATMWANGLNCLGIPGASMAARLRKVDIDSFDALHVHHDGDAAGDAFVREIAKRAHELDFTGEIAQIRFAPHKDVSDLFRSLATDSESLGAARERFAAAYAGLASAAVPVASPGANDVPSEEVVEPVEPVVFAELLAETRDFVRKYVVVSEDQLAALVLWVAHSHAFAAAQTTPYIAITSAEPGSGKTRLLETLSPIVRAPWMAARISAAALVRKVDKDAPTLLFDELDATFKGEKEKAEATRGILNSGYNSEGRATVCVGQSANIETRDLKTFCPKALAGIGKLPDTIRDRSIVIELKRKIAGEEAALSPPLRHTASGPDSASARDVGRNRDRRADGERPGHPRRYLRSSGRLLGTVARHRRPGRRRLAVAGERSGNRAFGRRQPGRRRHDVRRAITQRHP